MRHRRTMHGLHGSAPKMPRPERMLFRTCMGSHGLTVKQCSAASRSVTLQQDTRDMHWPGGVPS